MKIFIRVVYAFLIGFGFFVVFAYADAYYRKQIINDVGAKELENGNISFFVGSKYYNNEPMYFETVTQNNRTYDIYMYEVASYVKKGDSFDARSGISFIIHQTSGDMLSPRMYAKVFASDQVEKSYNLIQMADLPIYNLTNALNNLPVIELLDYEVEGVYQDITKIEISYSNSTAVTLSLDVSIDISKFNVANELKSYYDLNQAFLEESLNGVSVANNSFNTDDARVWIWAGAYIIVALSLTVFLIYYGKKKKLGKKELTPGLISDIENLNKNKEI